MFPNTAAWQTAEKARPFKVDKAPTWELTGSEILVRNHALAINPIDADLQKNARFPMKYPNIFGQDVAGEVVAVGPEVSRFSIGDRVLGLAVGLQTQRMQDHAFQSYTVLNSQVASGIPNGLSYEEAAVVPLGLGTAACGLFQPAPFLGLQLPTEPAKDSNGQSIVIWGGSSSVGSNAIQLAVAAGYRVVTTASKKNFEYVKKLGASNVFDHSSSNVVQDMVTALKDTEVAGALDCIGGAACVACVEILHQTVGKGAVATTKGGCDEPPEGITVKRIFGTTLKDNFVGPAIFQHFLPKALSSGAFVPSPAPRVVGHGLESIQEACDELLRGVSAEKLIVTL